MKSKELICCKIFWDYISKNRELFKKYDESVKDEIFWSNQTYYLIEQFYALKEMTGKEICLACSSYMVNLVKDAGKIVDNYKNMKKLKNDFKNSVKPL